MASRIADQAQGGEILVSSLLKELTDSAGDIQFGEGQEVELKGLAGLKRVHSVEWEEFRQSMATWVLNVIHVWIN